MISDELLYALPFHKIVELMTDAYSTEFGERKFHKVFEKIMNSNKFQDLINIVRVKQIPPTAKDFAICLFSIPYFMFCKGQTQAIGCLLALGKLHTEINSHFEIMNEYQLQAIAIQIVYEAKPTMR